MININYEISANFPIDVYFTPTEKDATIIGTIYKPNVIDEEIVLLTKMYNLNETLEYPSCYKQNIINKKEDCTLLGTGCMILVNKEKNNGATIILKYTAKTIEK